MLLRVLGLLYLAQAADVAAQEADAAAIEPPVRIDASAIGTRCLDLRHRPVEPAARPVAHRCTVVESDTLGVAGGQALRYAIYRHSAPYAPIPGRPENPAATADSAFEEELVVFAGPPGAPPHAVWHTWVDLDYDLLSAPALTVRPEGDYLAVPYCLNGTGGCRTEIHRLDGGRPTRRVVQDYERAFREDLPAGWGLWKGVNPDLDGMAATAALYLPGDANCCPQFFVRLDLTLRGDSLLLRDSEISLTDDGFDMHPTIVPGVSAGTIGPEATEAWLIRWLGPALAPRREVHEAEGFCTPGNVLMPGAGLEIEIAWADTARTRPAFVRIRRSPSDWATPAGVTIGTTLGELERLRGEPISFSGFGWDYGGGTGWDERLPSALARGPRAAFGLRLSPDSTAGRVLGERRATDPRVDELFGDRLARSDHPLLAGLRDRILVDEMTQTWASPAVSRECEPAGNRPPSNRDDGRSHEGRP